MFLDTLKNQLAQHQSLFIGESTAFRCAVMIPLVQVGGEWHVLFEVRSYTMRKQPGDISFPGGVLMRQMHHHSEPLCERLMRSWGLIPSRCRL